VGLRIAPTLLDSLARGRTIIVVSGTNGKTTTTALCVAGWGGDVTTNRTGANMPAGHVAALAGSSSEKVVLEADEAWLADVVSLRQSQGRGAAQPFARSIGPGQRGSPDGRALATVFYGQ